MNPRQELAAIYAQQAEAESITDNERRRLFEKVHYWGHLDDSTEAKPKTSTEPREF